MTTLFSLTAQSEGECENLLARGQLRCRRPLWHLGGLIIALLVRPLRLALAKNVRALAGHDGFAGVELRAVMGMRKSMFWSPAFDDVQTEGASCPCTPIPTNH